MSNRASTRSHSHAHGHGQRPRRIEDALSQLIDSLSPPLTLNDDFDGEGGQTEELLAAAEEQRLQANLQHAWRVFDTHATPTAGELSLPIGPAGYGIRSLVDGNINNASDLIKRKLLQGNAGPDRALRFSNLYSRLLTQPVLSQKWGILYLLYRLSGIGGDADANGLGALQMGDAAGTYAADEGGHGYYDRDGQEEEEGQEEEDDDDDDDEDEDMLDGDENEGRSPLMDSDNLQQMMFKGQHPHQQHHQRARRVDLSDDEGPAAGSSASQRPPRTHSRATTAPRRQQQQQQQQQYVSEENQYQNQYQNFQPASASRPPSPQEQQKHPEYGLLRDLPYNLQGLSSSKLEFSSSSTLKLPAELPIPMVSLLNALAEPCLLYRGLSSFVDSSDGGLISQSLRAALSNELRSYLGLVATLETEIRRALAKPGDPHEPGSTLKGGVTLKRCVVWTRDATMALRLMSLIVEEAKSKKGGQLISLIHGFSTSHGDPFVCAFAEKLLTHITRPFYDMLRLWIYDGELSDPFQEFFVVEPEFRPSMDPRRIATSVWEDKYKLDDNMVPSIITQDFAKKVFLIGKSLNFIRYGCGDSGWVEAYSKETSKELRYGDTASLETSIDEAYKTTMARLIRLMNEKFKLFDHLHALKKYLLLGQGDFIALLMESLASNLDRPANSQYRHNLTAQLEHAIRASNAQYDSPDVLRRLDARMLELSHGEIGWDCFTLEYKIDAPVDVVITPWGSTQYLKVFNFLWRVKRVEFALGSTWRRCMTGARGVLASVDDKVGSDWKRARCEIAEMIHFVNQLQYYILFEVIESSWEQLQAATSKPGCTLDDLIEAHTKYLNSITHKGLLGSSASSVIKKDSGKEEGFLTQLHQILKIMLAYKDVVDGLYSFSVAEFTRRQELSAKIETRTAQGHWGINETDPFSSTSSSKRRSQQTSHRDSGVADDIDSPFFSGAAGDRHDLAADDGILASLRVRLGELTVEFRSRLNILLGDLAYQPDVDMRFLGVMMNFNDVYEPVRRKRATATHGASTSTAPGTGTGTGTGNGNGNGTGTAGNTFNTGNSGNNGTSAAAATPAAAAAAAATAASGIGAGAAATGSSTRDKEKERARRKAAHVHASGSATSLDTSAQKEQHHQQQPRRPKKTTGSGSGAAGGGSNAG